MAKEPNPPTTLSDSLARKLFLGEEVDLAGRLFNAEADKADRYYLSSLGINHPLKTPIKLAPTAVQWRKVISDLSGSNALRTVTALRQEVANHNTYPSYKQAAEKYVSAQNARFMKTEWVTTQQAAESSMQWKTFEDRPHFQSLRYTTVGDEKVRPGHAELEGVTKPLDDPFWDEYMPPNGFNCRCTVVQTNEPLQNPKDDFEGYGQSEDFPAKFQYNPGKSINPPIPLLEGSQSLGDKIRDREISRTLTQRKLNFVFSTLSNKKIRESLDTFEIGDPDRYPAFIVLYRLDEWLKQIGWTGDGFMATGKFGQRDVSVNLKSGDIDFL